MNEDLIKAIEEGNLYDYIAQNYWQMSLEDLKNIILELDYAVYGNCDAATVKAIYKDMEEGLEERYE